MKDERIERRSHARQAVAGVRGRFRVKTEAEILNLSLTGTAVATGRRLAMGGTYRVIIRQGPRRLELGARVARSTLRARGTGATPEPVYEMGLEFLEVLGDRGHDVARFLSEHVEPEIGGRICDRFLPPPGTRAEIEHEEEFELLSVSPTGLAIETAADLEPGQDVALDVQIGKGFSTTGKVVYRQPVGPGRFRLGIEAAPAPQRVTEGIRGMVGSLP
jgi:hypothetical protein